MICQTGVLFTSHPIDEGGFASYLDYTLSLNFGLLALKSSVLKEAEK